MKQFENGMAVITGGGSGLGKALAVAATTQKGHFDFGLTPARASRPLRRVARAVSPLVVQVSRCLAAM